MGEDTVKVVAVTAAARAAPATTTEAAAARAAGLLRRCRGHHGDVPRHQSLVAAVHVLRQPEGARDQAADARQRALEDALETLADRADDLLDTQAGRDRTLERAVREARENRHSDNPLASGLSGQEDLEIAENDFVFQVESLILRGILRPGERLPPERELSDRMGVSRPSLREALAELQEGREEIAEAGGT